MQRVFSTLISAAFVAGLAACGSSGSDGPTQPPPPKTSPAAATIAATASLTFSPSTITIAPGGVVTFSFGTVAHTVLFDTGTNPPANITDPTENVKIPVTFATAGTYTFHCMIHPEMTGTVIVAASSTTDNGSPPPGY